MWNIIFNFIKKIFVDLFKWTFGNWKNCIIVFGLAISFVLYWQYKSIKNKYDNFFIETSDSLTTYKNKIGELYQEKNTYITDISNLKKYNSELADEIQNLKDNPVVVTKIKTETKIKEIVIKDTVSITGEGIYTFPAKYKDQWCNISGRSSMDINKMSGELKFDSISFLNNITIDLIEHNKQLSFIAKSDNPYSQINSINGAVISPEKSSLIKKRFDKKWVIVAGVGPTATIYDNKVIVTPGAQITFGYKLFSF